ncbi:MAG: signal peptidase II [Dehalococcoidia bacterium]|nr:signal peptidase II [Dehalococcoidia bacterium]MDH4299661.1 signal peptidase II [Dehalococcoidia bacterium]MDH4368123.1 signal peptidase II [Dehalococcoidia bacterium]
MQKGQDSVSPSKLENSKIPDLVGEDKSKAFPGKHSGRLRLFVIVAVLVVILDQLSKVWLDASRPQIQLLPGFLDLRYVENTGAIFGLWHTHIAVFISLGIVSVLAIVVFLYYFPPATTLGVVSFALILSGAAGNLIDRIRLGYVIDFISIHLRELFHWPAFNIADTALTVGIFALIYYFYNSGVFIKAHERNGKPQN